MPQGQAWWRNLNRPTHTSDWQDTLIPKFSSMIYRENDDRFTLQVGTGSDQVKLQLTCLNGTVAVVNFANLGPGSVGCGEQGEVGEEKALKGRRRLYTVTANNPMGNPVRFQLRFRSTVDELVITIPDDYEGTPPWNPADQNPTYQLIITYT